MLLPAPTLLDVAGLLRDHADATLESIGSMFIQLLPNVADRFRARCALLFLVQEEAFPDLENRLVAYYLLAHGYAWHDVTKFPFLQFYIQVAGHSSTCAEDRALLQALLHKGPAAFDDSTPSLLATRLTSEPPTLLTLAQLQASFWPVNSTEAPAADSFLSSVVPRSVYVMNNDHAGASSPPMSDMPGCCSESGAEAEHGRGQAAMASVRLCGDAGRSWAEQLATLVSAGGPSRLHGYSPQFARLPPPVMAPLPCERHCLHPPLPNRFIWDDAAEVDVPPARAFQRLLLDAQCRPLMPQQHKDFLVALESWPRLVHHIGFSPAQLPALVEHNNMIAVELLLKLLETNAPRISVFLDVLVHMDLSVHSMEVVKRLTSAVTLPEDFIHLYINSCIRACEAIVQKNQQNRPVRLVCVFLQSLIRTKIIDVKAVQYEVLSFCVKFSRIREAASLFRLLQSFHDQSGPGLAGGLQSTP